MDRRNILKQGSILILYEEKGETGPKAKFLVGKETGRGGSCIVYDAGYEDSVGSRHPVRLKECCPCGIDFTRNKEGRLCPAPKQRSLFEERKKQFVISYKKQVEIRQKTGLSNITTGTFQLYYGNGTVYSVMDCSEGEDYGNIKHESLKETLVRIRAVALALRQYHKAGYLHLDIKPENVWLIPETKELVQLFDFDSVVKKRDLAEMPGNLLMFTEAFAAPELAAGNVNQIGDVTDVYGVGALLFYKLTGKCPGRQEREYGAVYDFSGLKEGNVLVRPSFFERLEDFFHRTLAAAGELRFPTMEETAKALEQLIKLADTDAVYAVSDFSYHQDCFVGRERELKEIRERLSRKHLLFLHGMGGIGKTELAMRYAYENEKQYGTVLMLRVGWSLEESLCRDDIVLCNFEREETEDDRAYALRKLSALKACLTEHDLLILDNFDQENDGLLEEFLKLRCRILVTSRCDFSDWNYPQMEVGELEHMEELLALFENFNRLPYSDDEMDAVRELIRRVESHTMLTELMAKNLRVSGMAPSDLLEKLRQAAGTANMAGEPVRHRKDHVRRQAAVQRHLKVLFDISDLDETELFLLDNLSLFAGMRIKRETFLEWAGGNPGGGNQSGENRGTAGANSNGENQSRGNRRTAGVNSGGKNQNEENRRTASVNPGRENQDSQSRIKGRDKAGKEALDGLIRRGWIEKIRGEDKISLHQIILDLIYEERKPGGKSCRVLVGFLTEYAAQKPENQTERDIRNRLCTIAGGRLQGQDEETLAFYLAFCENIRYQEQWMDICRETYEKRKENFKHQLSRVYRLMGNEEIRVLDSLECILDQKLQQAAAQQAVSYFRKAIRYKEETADWAEYGKFLYYIGKFCSSSVETAMIEAPVAVTVYSFSLECMEKGAAIYEMQKERDKKLLKEMYDSLMDFFDPEAFCLVRPEYFGNVEKRLFYARKREQICPSRETDDQGKVIYSIDIHQLSYTDAGEQAEREGNLEEAVRYYELAAERQEEELIGCQDRIGYLYEQMGEYPKALAFFEGKYEEEKNSPEDGDRALCMGRLYKKTGQAEKAYAFVQESKAFFKDKIEQNKENAYWKGRFLQACLESIQISPEDVSAAEKWEEGLEFYGREREAVRRERSVLDFQMWWAERFTEMDERTAQLPAGRSYLEMAARMLQDAGENCLENYASSGEMGKVLELAEKIVGRVLPVSLKAELLTFCARLVHEMEGEGNGREKDFYEHTLRLLLQEKQGDTAQAAMIRWKLAGQCSYPGEDGKAIDYLSQCDYDMVAQFRAEEIKKDKIRDEMGLLQEMMEMWKEGGDRYGEAADFKGEAMGGEREAADCGREREEYGRYRHKFLQQAVRCYRQAADIWNQMEDSAGEKSLCYFGRIMEGLASVREQEEGRRKAEETITAWHREVLRMPGKEAQGLYDIMFELKRLAELYEAGDRPDQAILCLLERGIAGLYAGKDLSETESEYDTGTKPGILEDWRKIRGTEYDFGISEAKINRAAEIFFRRAEGKITKEQTDMVLETCKDIQKLCSQKERQELWEACRKTVKRYGEEQISFK